MEEDYHVDATELLSTDQLQHNLYRSLVCDNGISFFVEHPQGDIDHLYRPVHTSNGFYVYKEWVCLGEMTLCAIERSEDLICDDLRYTLRYIRGNYSDEAKQFLNDLVVYQHKAGTPDHVELTFTTTDTTIMKRYPVTPLVTGFMIDEIYPFTGLAFMAYITRKKDYLALILGDNFKDMYQLTDQLMPNLLHCEFVLRGE